MKHCAVIGLFGCAVALCAAVFGDAIVEAISNGQFLWRGNYTDRSSLDLLPVLVLAAAAFVTTKGLSLLEEAREKGLSTRSLILSTSRALTPREIARWLPVIFALQIVVLFGMETAEQFIVYGHTFGGTLWLGGPIAMSLLIHALCTLAATFSTASALSALSNALTRIVKCIFARFVMVARPAIIIRPGRVFCALALIVTASLVERGPPRLVAQS